MQLFTATIREDEDGLLWLHSDKDDEILGEVHVKCPDETPFDMSMNGYRRILDDYYVDSAVRVPDPGNVSVEINQ